MPRSKSLFQHFEALRYNKIEWNESVHVRTFDWSRIGIQFLFGEIQDWRQCIVPVLLVETSLAMFELGGKFLATDASRFYHWDTQIKLIEGWEMIHINTMMMMMMMMMIFLPWHRVDGSKSRVSGDPTTARHILHTKNSCLQVDNATPKWWFSMGAMIIPWCTHAPPTPHEPNCCGGSRCQRPGKRAQVASNYVCWVFELEESTSKSKTDNIWIYFFRGYPDTLKLTVRPWKSPSFLVNTIKHTL